MGDLEHINTPPIPAEWKQIIDTTRCLACGATNTSGYGFVIGAGTETHYAKLTCGDCGRFTRWLPNPDGKPRRDSNQAARAYWMEHLGGSLICAVCGIPESVTRADFHIHHIHRIEDGGDAQAVEATFPACQDCHVIAEALRAHQRHARGLSARQEQ